LHHTGQVQIMAVIGDKAASPLQDDFRRRFRVQGML
jgi:hypothetical protein